MQVREAWSSLDLANGTLPLERDSIGRRALWLPRLGAVCHGPCIENRKINPGVPDKRTNRLSALPAVGMGAIEVAEMWRRRSIPSLACRQKAKAFSAKDFHWLVVSFDTFRKRARYPDLVYDEGNTIGMPGCASVRKVFGRRDQLVIARMKIAIAMQSMLCRLPPWTGTRVEITSRAFAKRKYGGRAQGARTKPDIKPAKSLHCRLGGATSIENAGV
jgi:hypothetical protein